LLLKSLSNITKDNKMTEAGERLLEGALQALEFAKGNAKPGTYTVHFPEASDIKALRQSMKMSVSKFAEYFGLDEQTVLRLEAEAAKIDSASDDSTHQTERIP